MAMSSKLKIGDLDARQKGRLHKLVAVEAIKQVLAHYNFGTLAIPLMADDPDQFCNSTNSVVVLDNSKKIGEVIDVPDQSVAIVIRDMRRFVRGVRYADFHPEEHGLDPTNPSIDILWPVGDIRETFIELATIDAPPIKKQTLKRPVKVRGKADEVSQPKRTGRVKVIR